MDFHFQRPAWKQRRALTKFSKLGANLGQMQNLAHAGAWNLTGLSLPQPRWASQPPGNVLSQSPWHQGTWPTTGPHKTLVQSPGRIVISGHCLFLRRRAPLNSTGGLCCEEPHLPRLQSHKHQCIPVACHASFSSSPPNTEHAGTSNSLAAFTLDDTAFSVSTHQLEMASTSFWEFEAIAPFSLMFLTGQRGQDKGKLMQHDWRSCKQFCCQVWAAHCMLPAHLWNFVTLAQTSMAQSNWWCPPAAQASWPASRPLTLPSSHNSQQGKNSLLQLLLQLQTFVFVIFKWMDPCPRC